MLFRPQALSNLELLGPWAFDGAAGVRLETRGSGVVDPCFRAVAAASALGSRLVRVISSHSLGWVVFLT